MFYRTLCFEEEYPIGAIFHKQVLVMLNALINITPHYPPPGLQWGYANANTVASDQIPHSYPGGHYIDKCINVNVTMLLKGRGIKFGMCFEGIRLVI